MEDTTDKRPILCVGLVCVDIISICEKFPQEDSDARCIEQSWARGGNASNNCTVLSELGVPCEFMGTMAASHELGFLKDDFKSRGIRIDHCVCHSGCRCPFAMVIINLSSGSRTIINSKRNLPELSSADFKTLDLKCNNYRWIHFEGRTNADEIKKMVHHVRSYNESLTDPLKKITTSVELEKARPQLDVLLDSADVVFIGKDYARMHGYKNKEDTINGLADKCKPRCTVICAWGETGAIAKSPDGEIVTSPIFPPEHVIDTLGAGDSFTAATIFALSRYYSLEKSLRFGCRVAGFKVGNRGFGGIGKWYTSELES